MTDPLALDPVLPPRERSERSARPWNEDRPHDERYELFEAHVVGGGKDADSASSDAYDGGAGTSRIVTTGSMTTTANAEHATT